MVERTPGTGAAPRPLGGKRARSRGQSLVEFAVILPILLTLLGIVIDAARVYQAWLNLESATRDAAQYLATSDTDPTSPEYTTAGVNADNKAIFVLNEATGAFFTRSNTQGTLSNCNLPRVTTTFTADTATANGGTSTNPVGTARVQTCMPFQTLFSYPLLTNNGVWVISSDRSYKILVGR
jgi:Flp pilus assembly protein TadG